MSIDDHIGNVQRYPVLANWAFFNHAGVSPLPRATADAMKRYADEASAGAYLKTTWWDDIEKLRTSAARLIGGTAEEIAFIKNTGEGISLIARGIEWKSGDRIITTAVEYPTNIYPWMDVQRHHGAELVLVPEATDADGRRAVPLDAILKAADHPRTRLIALSHVEYASGQRHDLAAIGAWCRPRGILLAVDAIQSVGIVPVDVSAMNVDYLSADGHKWMLGPDGAGIFYCRADLIAKTRPLTLGASSVINAMDFGNYDFTLRPGARRFECGAQNVAGLMGLWASVELLLAVGIDAIGERIKFIGDQFLAAVERKGYTVVSPRRGEQWSGNLCFRTDKLDQQKLVASLRSDHAIEIAFREGRLRASPHFYNSDAQIDRLIELLPNCDSSA